MKDHPKVHCIRLPTAQESWQLLCRYGWLGTNSRRPLAGAPISVTLDILQMVPLNCSWYLAPVKGSDTLGEPL